jgi:putative aldouronate transport system substrate-binding protein
MLERQQAWILGARDVDKDWPEYVARLDKLGLGRVLAVMQSAWQRRGH